MFQNSNRLIAWSVETAEGTVVIAFHLTKPALELYKPVIVLLDGPINLVDEILCKSLDMIEDAVPLIKREPDEVKFAKIDWLMTQSNHCNRLRTKLVTYVGNAIINVHTKSYIRFI